MKTKKILAVFILWCICVSIGIACDFYPITTVLISTTIVFVMFAGMFWALDQLFHP